MAATRRAEEASDGRLPIPASEFASRVGITPIELEQMTTGERAVRNINRFGTEALAGTTALARTAAKRAATDGARTLPRIRETGVFCAKRDN